MTASIILVVIALSLPLILLRLTKGQKLAPDVLKNPSNYIRSVDLQAFRNLVDPAEEEFLRTHLPASDFREIQRERLRATIDYISCVRDNAGILVRVGEAARKSNDPAIAAAGAKLVDDAIRFRMYAFVAVPKLYVGMLLPGRTSMSGSMADTYEQMTHRLASLGQYYPASSHVAS